MPYNPSRARKDTRAGRSLCFYSTIKWDCIVSKYELTGYFKIGKKDMKENRKSLLLLSIKFQECSRAFLQTKISLGWVIKRFVLKFYKVDEI